MMSKLEITISANTREGSITLIHRKERAAATVSGEFLVQLLRESAYRENGMVLIGATIIGSFDCSDLEIRTPIRLLGCRFEKPIQCSRANLYLLDLRRSDMPGLVLTEATLAHSIQLRRTTIISKNLISPAIDANLLNVMGQIDLSYSHVKGTMTLLSTVIGGQLNCRGATLANENGKALVMDEMKVKGSVFLNGGFSANGEIRLHSAVIGGQLNCRGATLANENGKALVMDEMKVKGSVFLNGGFSANGEVRLHSEVPQTK